MTVSKQELSTISDKDLVDEIAKRATIGENTVSFLTSQKVANLDELENKIKSLKLKNEKLTANQKKLYGYLGDA